MATSRSVLGFLNPKTFTFIFTNSAPRNPIRLLHSCKKCDRFLGIPVLNGTSLPYRNCKFSRFYYIISFTNFRRFNSFNNIIFILSLLALNSDSFY